MRSGALLLALAVACTAAKFERRDGRFVHRGRGFAIDIPNGNWRTISLRGADLALRGPAGQRMSFTSRCNVPIARAEVLARHLRFAIGSHRLIDSGAAEGLAGDAWLQVLEADSLRLKTVTLVESPCVYDWSLAARREFEDAEVVFDRWWRSFRPARRASVPEVGP